MNEFYGEKSFLSFLKKQLVCVEKFILGLSSDNTYFDAKMFPTNFILPW